MTIIKSDSSVEYEEKVFMRCKPLKKWKDLYIAPSEESLEAALAAVLAVCICTNGMHMHMHVHMQDARPPYVHMAIEKRLLCGA